MKLSRRSELHRIIDPYIIDEDDPDYEYRNDDGRMQIKKNAPKEVKEAYDELYQIIDKAIRRGAKI